MPLNKKLLAEFIGTFWLVLGGCGAVALTATLPNVGVALAFAFGLTVLTGVFAPGYVIHLICIARPGRPGQLLRPFDKRGANGNNCPLSAFLRPANFFERLRPAA